MRWNNPRFASSLREAASTADMQTVKLHIAGSCHDKVLYACHWLQKASFAGAMDRLGAGATAKCLDRRSDMHFHGSVAQV